MRPLDSKPRPWAIWCLLGVLALTCIVAWHYGILGASVILGLGVAAYHVLEVWFLRASTGKQDHMTKNPGRGS